MGLRHYKYFSSHSARIDFRRQDLILTSKVDPRTLRVKTIIRLHTDIYDMSTWPSHYCILYTHTYSGMFGWMIRTVSASTLQYIMWVHFNLNKSTTFHWRQHSNYGENIDLLFLQQFTVAKIIIHTHICLAWENMLNKPKQVKQAYRPMPSVIGLMLKILGDSAQH